MRDRLDKRLSDLRRLRRYCVTRFCRTVLNIWRGSLSRLGVIRQSVTQRAESAYISFCKIWMP